MADITDERLREIASSDPLVLAICAKMGEPSWADVRAIAAELRAARAQLHADDQRAWEALGKPEGTHDTTNVQRLCAEVDRLRLAIFFGGCSAVHAASLSEAGGEWAVKAVQDLDGLRAEVERLRADLREAMELLEAASPNMGDAEWDEWGSKVNKLLEKHKETNQ